MENNYNPAEHVVFVRKQPVWAFCLLSFFTFGFYNIYWFYRNWRFLKELYDMDIYPFWRAIFSIFFVHSLLEQIDHLAIGKGHPGIRSNIYATGYIIFAVIVRTLNRAFPEITLLLFTSLLPFLFLVPSVSQLNYIHEHTNPDEYHPVFNPWELIILLLGGLLMVFIIIGIFVS